MKEIGGKVALVTGASRGLGRAIAQTLFDHGMKVVVSARGAGELEAFRKQLDKGGTRSLAVAADVTSAADRAGLVAAATRKFGTIDVLVNNAGTDHPEFFADTDFKRVQDMADLNFVSVMGMTHAVLPSMLGRGSGQIVNIASTAGMAPVPYAAVYAATKAAIIGFSMSLRYEVGEHGVGVSVVCPNFVRGSGQFHVNSGGDTLGQPTVSPEDVGDAVVSAITANRGRVIVSPPQVKLTPLLTSISPALTHFAARRTGADAAFRKMAQRVREREEQPMEGAATTAPSRPAPSRKPARRRPAVKPG